MYMVKVIDLSPFFVSNFDIVFKDICDQKHYYYLYLKQY